MIFFIFTRCLKGSELFFSVQIVRPASVCFIYCYQFYCHRWPLHIIRMHVQFRSCPQRWNRKTNIRVLCLLLPILLSPLAASWYKESRCAFVGLLMASYWLLEPVPIAVTSLLPVFLFPFLGVASSAEVSQNYMKETVMFFTGCLFVGIGVEECNLHERIALKGLLLFGVETKWLLLGFMMTTMLLSMWMNNAAATVMMIPIVEAVIREITSNDESKEKEENSTTERKPEELGNSAEIHVKEKQSNIESSTIRVALMLGVCYASNIGGTGTLVGSGANMMLKGFMEELYPTSHEITFTSILMYNIPGMLLCTVITWLTLWLMFIRGSEKKEECKDDVRNTLLERYRQLGSLTCYEAEVLFLYIAIVLLWIFRDPKLITGWLDILGSDVKIGNSAPTFAVAFLTFFLPSDIRDWSSRPILHWKTAQAKMPWGLLILVGGGFALADGFQKSGLSKVLQAQLSFLSALPPAAVMAVMCLMTAMLTEIISNTVTANLMLPLLNQMAISVGMNPLYLMLPVTLICSYAFMLPISTGTNAIVFEMGNIRTIDMVKPGIILNVLCCAVQLLMANTLGVAMFDLHNFPSWVNQNELSNFTGIELQNKTVFEASTVYYFQ